MESNPSHSQTLHTLAGSAAKTARSLSSDNIFDKTARELLADTSAEVQMNSSTSDEEVHTSETTLGESNQSEEETSFGDEVESLDEKLDKYLDSTDDNSSTEEEAEQEMNTFEKKWEQFQQMFQQLCQLRAAPPIRFEATLELGSDGRYEPDATPAQKENICKLTVSRRASEAEEGEVTAAYDEGALIDTEGLLNLCRHMDDDENDSGANNREIIFKFLCEHFNSIAKLLKLNRIRGHKEIISYRHHKEGTHQEDNKHSGHKDDKDDKRHKKSKPKRKRRLSPKGSSGATLSSENLQIHYRRSFKASKMLAHSFGALAYHTAAENLLKTALGVLLRMFNVAPPVTGRSLHLLCYALKGIWKERPDLLSEGARKLAFKYILMHIYDHNVCSFLGEMLGTPNTATPLFMQDRGVSFFKQLIRRGLHSSMQVQGLYNFLKFHVIEQFERAERSVAISGQALHLANLRHLGDAMTAALSTPGMLDSLCAGLAPSALYDKDPEIVADAKKASATCADVVSLLIMWMSDNMENQQRKVRFASITRSSDVHIKAYLEWFKNTAVVLSDKEKAYLQEYNTFDNAHNKRRKRKKAEKQHKPPSPASSKKRRKRKKHGHDGDPTSSSDDKPVPAPPVVHQPPNLALRVDPQVVCGLKLVYALLMSGDSNLRRLLLGSKPGVAQCLGLSLMRVVMRIFTQHPWNNIVHNLVCEIVLSVLDIENDKMHRDSTKNPLYQLTSDLIHRCGFPDLFVTFLESKDGPHKVGQRRLGVTNVAAVPAAVRLHCKDTLSTGKGFPQTGRRPDFGAQLYRMAHAMALISRAQLAWRSNLGWQRFTRTRLPEIAMSFSPLQPAMHIFLFGRLRDDCASAAPAANTDAHEKYMEIMQKLYQADTAGVGKNMGATDRRRASKAMVVSATLERALMYCREGSADPYVVLDDDDAAADKDSIDTPRVFGRLLLCSSLGMLRSKLEALQRFMLESHTSAPKGKGKGEDGQSAAPIYALLAMAKARSAADDSSRDGKGGITVDKVEGRKTYVEVLVDSEDKDRRMIVQAYTVSILTQKEALEVGLPSDKCKHIASGNWKKR